MTHSYRRAQGQRMGVEPTQPYGQRNVTPSLCLAVRLAHGRDKNEGAGNAKDSGDQKRRLRRILPEQASNGRSRSDRHTPHQVVKPDAASAKFGCGEIDNHRFASGFADLAQAANDERYYQAREIVRANHGQWIEGKRAEGRNYEWPA